MQPCDFNPHKLVYGAVGSDDRNLCKECETPSSFAAKDTLRERAWKQYCHNSWNLESVQWDHVIPSFRKAEERCVSVMSSFLWHKIAPVDHFWDVVGS